MRKIAGFLCAAAFVLAAPAFATTTCQAINLGPSDPYYECINGSPTSSSNFTFYSSSQDSMCYLFPNTGLYKSLGAYGSGNGDWAFTAPDSPYGYVSVEIILDLNNTHNHSGNRVAVLVYDDDAYTVETLGTIDGSGGDICSGVYRFNVYRPGWEGKHLRLTITPWFQDYDANSKVGLVSMTFWSQQPW